MRLSNMFVLWKLLFKSSNRVVSFGLLATPIFVILAAATLLFSKEAISSYAHFQNKSYIGVFGRLEVVISDPKKAIDFFDTLAKNLPNETTIYQKSEEKIDLEFLMADRTIKKSITLIASKKEALLHRGVADGFVAINTPLAISLNHPKELTIRHKDRTLHKLPVFVIESGFLISKPILFIRDADRNSLLENIKLPDHIELWTSPLQNIDEISEKIYQLASKTSTQLMLIDPIAANSEASKVYSGFEKIANYTTVLILLLSFVMSLSLALIIVLIKKPLFGKLSRIGVSKKEIGNSLFFGAILLTFVLFLGAILVASLAGVVFASEVEFELQKSSLHYKELALGLSLFAFATTAIFYYFASKEL